MSDPRKPTIKLKRELPGKTGRFRPDLIIELYPAWQWSEKFCPKSDKRKCCLFYGKKIPMKSADTEGYYRIRVNGKWYSEVNYEYEFYPEQFAYSLAGRVK